VPASLPAASFPAPPLLLGRGLRHPKAADPAPGPLEAAGAGAARAGGAGSAAPLGLPPGAARAGPAPRPPLGGLPAAGLGAGAARAGSGAGGMQVEPASSAASAPPRRVRPRAPPSANTSEVLQRSDAAAAAPAPPWPSSTLCPRAPFSVVGAMQQRAQLRGPQPRPRPLAAPPPPAFPARAPQYPSPRPWSTVAGVMCDSILGERSRGSRNNISANVFRTVLSVDPPNPNQLLCVAVEILTPLRR